MEAAFLEIQPKLEQIARKFARESGHDGGELVSIAYETFVDLETNWNVDHRKAWKSYVCQKAWWSMQSYQRSERRWHERHAEFPRGGSEPEQKIDRAKSLLASLSADAETVCRLVLETPTELIEALAAGEPYRCRVSLRNWLQGLGWTAERVMKAFQELREALS